MKLVSPDVLPVAHGCRIHSLPEVLCQAAACGKSLPPTAGESRIGVLQPPRWGCSCEQDSVCPEVL